MAIRIRAFNTGHSHEIQVALGASRSGAANIFKVQMPLSHNMDQALALVYNGDRSIEFYTPADQDLVKAMNGDAKRYFYFKPARDDRGDCFELTKEAPWQDW